MRIKIIGVGLLKKGPYHDLYQDYARRMRWDVVLEQVECKKNLPPEQLSAEEAKLIEQHLDSNHLLIALDERGQTFGSIDFSQKIEQWQNQGQTSLQFILGGANGLDPALRQKANLLISFGRMTWPHMMARVMLLEQLYRAQQILAGHPYHKV